MTPLAFDIRTLSFITMIITSLLGIGLFFFGYVQKTFKGFTLLSFGSLSFALGFLLLGYRDVLPDFTTIVIANTFLVIAITLFWEGAKQFLEVINYSFYLSIILVILNLLLFSYFTYFSPSVNSRIVVVSTMLSIVSFLCVREFIQVGTAYRKIPELFTASAFAIFGLFQAFRVFWTLGEGPIQSFMQAGTVHGLAFIVIILLQTSVSFGFIWLASKKLEYKLIHLANHDQLTGILNRRGIDEKIAEFTPNAKINGNEITVIVFDIDEFKTLNDQYGHYFGDTVLVSFTNQVVNNLEGNTVFGRFGGDEFMIILFNKDINDGTSLAEKIRKNVEGMQFKVENQTIKITASFGVSSNKSNDQPLEKIISTADQALYRAKEAGKNQIAKLLPH